MKLPPPEHSLRRLIMLLRADGARYRKPRAWCGYWATVSYRIRRTRRYGGPLAKIVLLAPDALLRIGRPWIGDCEISQVAEIGPGLYLPHPQGVTIGPCRIGPRVNIFQQVTLGSWQNQFPLVRAYASIFGGAKVFGGVVIGRHAFVGANAVVTRHVPDYHTAIGCAANPIVAAQPRGLAAPGRAKNDAALYFPADGKPVRPTRRRAVAAPKTPR